MKVVERNVMRLLAVQHLRTAYGVKTKNWNKNKASSCKTTASSSTKVFGVSLEILPYYNMESGSVPSFLVDACMNLMAHVDTEGLFRKSGSVIRLKALRAKLDAGEECLSTALPCDVAGLVKQFFRELPEPLLPAELQEAFLKAQQLPSEEDRTSATMLLSCVLPDRNLSVLRHFFDFLYNVSQRSAENKMDSSNLSVILAPNLLHSGDGTEKMNANTEKRLRLQAAVVQCFIENALRFGVLPQFLLAKVPATMGCEVGVLSPSLNELEELDMNSGMKRKQRRSFGDMVNGALNKIKNNRTPTHASQSDSLVFSSATPVIATPSSKRKLPSESGHSFGFSNKKRRSVKKSLGIDLLPNTLFSGLSTPGSAYSASGVLDSSQNAPSPAGRSKRQSVTSVRRKSRRLSSRHAVNRVESGRAGCFSPKVNKKEAPRKSLRLRFSLGRGSKEAGSESIGWRLATQESTTSFLFTKETEFSPSVLPRKKECKSTKYISKSEDNLLTPQCNPLQTSWSVETPVGAQAFSDRSFTDTPMNMCLKNTYLSEPAIVASKPPAVSSRPMKLCCASSAESLESESSIAEAQSQTGPTLLKIQKAFTESGSDLQAVVRDSCSSAGANMTQPSDIVQVCPPETPTNRVCSADTSTFPSREKFLANDQNITFGQIEIAALSPLHIDSVLFESGVYCSSALKADKSGTYVAPVSPNGSMVGDSESEEEQVNCSRLIDALDMQSPAHFKLGVTSGQQSTPYKKRFELHHELGTSPRVGTKVSTVQEKDEFPPGIDTKVQNQPALSPRSLEVEKRRVAEHIQHFNKLTLHSPRGPKGQHIRSPLKFQRTPVRQTVRRINSLLGENRRPTRSSLCGPVVKAVSMESGLSPHPQLRPHQDQPPAGESNSRCPIKKPPPVPPKKPSTLARRPRLCALGDVTNKVQPKTRVDSSVAESSGAQKPLVLQVAEKEMNHYRGSPRNPLNQARLLSATRPVDL
ncbi:rho GTPase-activating protein 11A isoform X1 [Platichthys flesus]|uniref:rho GTPase-activating protein 11A isoform X1 n=1 Tax=Platichthys flesus TaxID=8260 RepID=UPI002DBCDFEB|nr:rho GTPase-activating protein 11A isoform X1 [Platichthys flesus]